ncbi:MAG: 4Fe-4S cluster-binding domain-containing protein [Methanomicrobiales archaeon]|jgi:pyruvate formate-lyase activating enzyme-like uncharacterized protein|nr:4Fe-4S cluster-binding domain-containing protein [Methanomicrobiales archaeon]
MDEISSDDKPPNTFGTSCTFCKSSDVVSPPLTYPAQGCTFCVQGAKMVLFITGLCTRTCWYCPLSQERKGQDRIYANEHEITSPDESLIVAEKMSALGTGITGGEPFLVIERVVEFTRVLKETYGNEHHIHLYSGIPPTKEDLEPIIGLVDEIRLHPPIELWDDISNTAYAASVKLARSLGFHIGFEVPSFPGIEKFEPFLTEFDFLNINELEWGDTNADAMRSLGYEFLSPTSNAVFVDLHGAQKFLKEAKVHWCSSNFKDSIQLRRRLIRIATNTARPFDEITEDGTILYGVLEGNPNLSSLKLTKDMYTRYHDRIELAWWILEDIISDVSSYNPHLIERYPDGGHILEVIPL